MKNKDIQLRKYKVKITETLVREVTVEAKSCVEATHIVEDNWYSSKEGYVLDSSDFVGADFSTNSKPLDRE